MDTTFDALTLKASPLFWLGTAIIAGSLFGAVLGLWLPRVTPLLAG